MASRRRPSADGCSAARLHHDRGATTIEELQFDLGALSLHVDTEVAERLDRIWPGPGEAPQAYAK